VEVVDMMSLEVVERHATFPTPPEVEDCSYTVL